MQPDETHIDFQFDSKDSGTKSTTWFKYGLYEGIETLATEINTYSVISQHQKLVKPTWSKGYSSLEKTCECPEIHKTSVSRKIGQVFGFDDASVDGKTGKFYFELSKDNKHADAEHPACILRALTNTIFIYSDICTPYNVGNSRSSLLRIVSIDLAKYVFGNTIVKSFSPVHYLPLISNRFQNICIDIRDQYGEPLAFEFGTLTVKLHLKRER